MHTSLHVLVFTAIFVMHRCKCGHCQVMPTSNKCGSEVDRVVDKVMENGGKSTVLLSMKVSKQCV